MASKRKILTLRQRVYVIKRLDAGLSVRAVALEVGCGKTQIGCILGQKADIMKDLEAGCRADLNIKRRKTQNEELNGLVWDWFCTARSKELPVSVKLIQVCFCRLQSYVLTSYFFYLNVLSHFVFEVVTMTIGRNLICMGHYG